MRAVYLYKQHGILINRATLDRDSKRNGYNYVITARTNFIVLDLITRSLGGRELREVVGKNSSPLAVRPINRPE